jgi:hypothetical protein
MALDFNSVVGRTEGLMSTPLDRDLVILNPDRDNYISLDEIGRRIWELLDAPDRVDTICRKVAQEYQGDEQEITADLLSFLRELEAEGLVHVAQS